MKTAPKFLICGAAIITICLFGLTQCFHLPTDESLRDYFQTHKTAYFSLLKMLQEDKDIRRICQNEIAIHDPNDSVSDIIVKPIDQTNFSRDRFEQYGKLIADVDAESIWQNEDGSVQFSKGGWGMAGSGVRWGYIWLPTSPAEEELLSTMDDFKKKGPYSRGAFRYVSLEGQWYMFIIAP